MDPVSQYARMAAAARMGEALTPAGDARCFTVAFPAHHDASAFIRRAGGANMERIGIDAKAWRWTMPDGLYAILGDGESLVTFTDSITSEAYWAGAFRMEGGAE